MGISNLDMKAPLVSVIVPTFNSEKTIERCIRSVLSQTYTVLEAIICDDASSDGTIEIVERLMLEDRRIVILRNAANQGAGYSRNRCIEHAKGRYIAFLDSDDQWMCKKLDIQLQFLDENPQYPLVCAGYVRFNRKGQSLSMIPPKEISYEMLKRHCYVGCLTAMYDTTRTDGKVFMPTIRRRQDWALWLDITQRWGPIGSLPELLGVLHRGHKSLSSNKITTLKYSIEMLQQQLGVPYFRAAYYAISHNIISGARLLTAPKANLKQVGSELCTSQ